MPMRSVRCFSGTGSAEAATASRMASPRSRLWIGGVSCVCFPLMAGSNARHRISLPFGPIRPAKRNAFANATRVAYSAPGSRGRIVATALEGVKPVPGASKEEHMRRAVWLFVLAVLLPWAAAAQETRANINGVVQDAGGVIPGAVVRITNAGTSQTNNYTIDGVSNNGPGGGAR